MRSLATYCLVALVGLVGCREFASYSAAPGSDVTTSDVGADVRGPVDLRADAPEDGPTDMAGERSADLQRDRSTDVADDQATADLGHDTLGDQAIADLGDDIADLGHDIADLGHDALDDVTQLDSSPTLCAVSCPGCCLGQTCITATGDTQCGQGGSACSDCTLNNSTCQKSVCNAGFCEQMQLNEGGACAVGSTPGRCNKGACCTGCIDWFGKCRPGTSIGACGTSGGSCSPCAASLDSCKQPVCKSGVCGSKQAPPKTACKDFYIGGNLSGLCDGSGSCCLGCLDAGNVCHVDDALNCGRDGDNCKSCTTNQVCRTGQCTSPGTCSGCADGCCEKNSCVRFSAQSAALCGSGGYGCIDCGAQRFCKDGVCRAGTCTPVTCFDGCCAANGACVTSANQTDAICGTGGNACKACGPGDFCGTSGCGSP